MQAGIPSTEQLTVHLVDPSTMAWAVLEDGKRVHEGDLQSCEAFLDWYENCCDAGAK